MSIRCPQCGLTSYNPHDVREKYCGNCRQFHDTMRPRRTDGEFVLTSESDHGRTEIWDRGGVSWHQAPLPRRWHKCVAQTRGWLNYFQLIERCACGAINIDGRGWGSRNERRKSR